MKQARSLTVLEMDCVNAMAASSMLEVSDMVDAKL
jgi:hypothetical protein